MPDGGWEHDIEILNTLIGTTLDNVAGYEEAATNAANPGHRNLFLRRVSERRRVVLDLQRQVRALGGTPKDHDAVRDRGVRLLISLGTSLAKDDALGVISELERSEDYITNKYEEAIDDDEVSVNIRTAVVRAYASVKSGHEQMRDLSHRMKLRSSDRSRE